jgi:hypothetical protein
VPYIHYRLHAAIMNNFEFYFRLILYWNDTDRSESFHVEQGLLLTERQIVIVWLSTKWQTRRKAGTQSNRSNGLKSLMTAGPSTRHEFSQGMGSPSPLMIICFRFSDRYLLKDC